MTTDDYISAISKRSNKFGSQLLALMDKYHKTRLKDITLEEAKEFYEYMVKNEIDDTKKY